MNVPWRKLAAAIVSPAWYGRAVRLGGLLSAVEAVDTLASKGGGDLFKFLANETGAEGLVVLALFLTVELVFFPRAIPSTGEPALNAADKAHEQADLSEFLRSISLADVTRFMVIANTGQVTVRTFLETLERLSNEQTVDELKVDILLRSPHNSDQRRAEGTTGTIALMQRLDSRGSSRNSLGVEHRFYATTLPFRCVLVEHRGGEHSAFISFYDWQLRGQRQAVSTRDAANKGAVVVRKTSAPHTMLDVCLSWFLHLWGIHNLHTLVFDFDDTLFSTTEPQVNAWLGALRDAIENGKLSEDDLAPELRAKWGDNDSVHKYALDAFFSAQRESEIFARFVPNPSKREAIFEFVRKARLAHREAETLKDAQPAPNISRQELERLGAEYALVIVSATDERLIARILERWDLELFPYIVGREAPRQDWLDVETKSQNLLRVSNLLGVPLERMAFIGDSDADYRSARQLGVRFIENRYNAEFYRRGSLIKDANADIEGCLSRDSQIGDLTRMLAQIDAAMR